MTVWLLAWLAIFEASQPASAQLLEEVQTVTRVTVTGNQRIEEAVVLAAIGLRSGEALTREKVRRDIKAIYATGFFDDVVVTENEVHDGLVLDFRVVEKPAIRTVTLQGNKKINEESIREVLDVRSFAVLNESRVQDNVSRVRDLYIEKGFYLVDIEVRYEPLGAGQVDVVFDIEENRKVIVQRVDISGNEAVSDRTLKRNMYTKEGGSLPWLSSRGTFRQEAIEVDREQLRALYYDRGYLDVQVSEPKVYLSPDKRYIYVSYDITEGEPYTVGTIAVDGDFSVDEGLSRDSALQVIGGRAVTDLQEEQWRAAEGKRKRLIKVNRRSASVQTGTRFTRREIFGVAKNIETLWADQGYAFTNVVPDVRQDPDAKIADITYQIERGDRARVGKIHITGNVTTFDKVIRREIRLNEGDVYRRTLEQASRGRIARLGFFDDVAISNTPGASKELLDMHVKVSERPTGSFNIGAGFSSTENFQITGQVFRENFLGLGYSMRASVDWSSRRQSGSIGFRDTHFLDTRWIFDVSAQSTNDATFVDNEIVTRRFVVALGRPLDSRDELSLSLIYRLSDRGSDAIDPTRQKLFGGELYRSGLRSELAARFLLDRRNDRVFPTKGILASTQFGLSGGFGIGDGEAISLLGGEFKLFETLAEIRGFQPIIGDDDTLVFRASSQFSNVVSTDGREVPFFHRFFAGGINSIRGFGLRQIGPFIRVPRNDDPVRAEDKLITGGRTSWINQFELETPIIRSANITAVVFVDAGNVYNGIDGGDPFDPFSLRTSYGGGVRWTSPFGPLRFEIGFPFKPREDERTSVFEFGIGRPF